jgi:hypothetical protein
MDRFAPGQVTRQRGMTLIGFIFVLAFVLFFVYIGIKLVPIDLNHMSVASEVKALAQVPASANTPPNTLRRDLMTRLQVSYVDYVEPSHISVQQGGRERSLVVEYQVETHLIANIDAVLSFKAEEPLRPN